MEQALTAVCRECKNYFTKTVERGTYTISGSVITLQSTYLVGQYIRVVGSLLNDGVYKVTDNFVTLTGASDEVFEGAVCGLAIPAEFLELVAQIDKSMQQSKDDKSDRTLVSESYSNYSYSRATSENGSVASWKEAFASQLNSYRRMFEERI